MIIVQQQRDNHTVQMIVLPDVTDMEPFNRNEAAMSGPAALTINLDERQWEQLQQVVRSQKTPKRLCLRAKVVLLAVNGWSNSAISTKLDYHRGAVVQWRQRFAEEGIEGLYDFPRPGRPAAFPPPEQKHRRVALACTLPVEAGYPFTH